VLQGALQGSKQIPPSKDVELVERYTDYYVRWATVAGCHKVAGLSYSSFRHHSTVDLLDTCNQVIFTTYREPASNDIEQAGNYKSEWIEPGPLLSHLTTHNHRPPISSLANSHHISIWIRCTPPPPQSNKYPMSATSSPRSDTSSSSPFLRFRCCKTGHSHQRPAISSCGWRSSSWHC
jgi:hypothetical protein